MPDSGGYYERKRLDPDWMAARAERARAYRTKQRGGEPPAKSGGMPDRVVSITPRVELRPPRTCLHPDGCKAPVARGSYCAKHAARCYREVPPAERRLSP